MSDSPLVSVIIPCYQAERYVRQAIESVIAQTYPNLEVFAIDDGSTDTTLAILKEYARDIAVLQHPGGVNRGVSLTRKLGIDNARGEFIAFLDADDFFVPDKITAQVALLRDRPDVVLCHTGINQITEMETGYDGRLWFNYAEDLDRYDLKMQDVYLKANRICNSSVLVRADIVRSLPFAGEQLFQFEDWLTWTLAAEYGDFIFTPQRLLNYRVHPASATSAILASKLKRLYSYLEFYIAVFAHSRNQETRVACLVNLLEKLDDIENQYAGGCHDDRQANRLSTMLSQLPTKKMPSLSGIVAERLVKLLPWGQMRDDRRR